MATKKQYRQYTAREIGRFRDGTANATGNATNSMVADVLKSTIAQDNLWDDFSLYMPGAVAADDRSRIVKTYTPLTGALEPDRNWGVAPNGLAFELLPGIDTDELHVALNEGLKDTFVTVEFTITAVANARRHTAPSWLTDESWVRQVGYLTTAEVRANTDPYRYREVRGQAVRDGATVYIEHPDRTFSTTEVIYVRAIKPAYNHCRAAGGAYGDQSGLTLETDEAPVPERWAAFATMLAVLRRDRGLWGEQGDALRRRGAEISATFGDETAINFTLPLLAFRPPVVRWNVGGTKQQVSRK